MPESSLRDINQSQTHIYVFLLVRFTSAAGLVLVSFTGAATPERSYCADFPYKRLEQTTVIRSVVYQIK